MKTKKCPEGRYTSIIHNFGRGYAQIFNIEIESVNSSQLSGEYIEKRYFWIFPKSPVKGKIYNKMQFRRYWINGIYSVSIKPDQDVIVKIH